MSINEFSFENHDEWLAIRSRFIGGSDAGAVIGMNPYKSRYSLWCEKTGRTPGFSGNTVTRVGAYLEDLVATMFEEEHGCKVRRRNFTLVNDLYPFACANVDRMVVGEKAFLECKTTNNPLVLKQLRGDEFPEAYYAQCVHYLAVTGLERAYLAVLSESRDFKVYTLDRDQAEIDALMAAEKDFWDLVENDKEPAIDGMDATKDALLEMYPTANSDAVDLLGYRDKLSAYISLNAQINELKEVKESIGNEIRAVLKEASKGICEGYSITYGNRNKSTFDKEKFVKAHPEINVNEFFTESNSRTLTIKEIKKK